MNLEQFVHGAQWLFLGFFVFLNLGYMSLNLIAMFSLRRYMEARGVDSLHFIDHGEDVIDTGGDLRYISIGDPDSGQFCYFLNIGLLH